jgi:hypothetical protein
MSAITIAPHAVRGVPRAQVGSASASRLAARGRSARERSAREPAPLRLTRRGRVVVGVLGLALAAGAGGATLSAHADGPSVGTEVERLVVQPGDTLWAIAAEVAAPGEDVRDVVLMLMRMNELPSGGLAAGQTIVVPAG